MKLRRYIGLILTAGILMMTGCSAGNDGSSESTAEESTQTTTAPVESEEEAVVTTSFKEPSEYGKVIALTFDDGPSVYSMSVMLDTFEKYNAKASFFLIGNNINEGTSAVVKRAFEMGCEIDSHSQTHSYMNQMTEEEIKAEMEYTDGLIEEITGVVPEFFRPPYIAVNDTMFECIDKPFINGYGCSDWDESVDSETIAQRVLENAQDGEIILLHDTERTAEALETIIPSLMDDGYELVTVAELFHAKEVVPQEDGMVYTNVLQTTMY